MIILNSGIGNYIYVRGKKYSCFGGNNYLGLANNPRLKQASIRAIKKYGVNLSASRITTGTSELHLELEKQLSLFKKREDTILFPSGYQGNSVLLGALTSSNSAVFIDQNAHPSIQDSIPGYVPLVQHYNHCDACHLEILLERLPKNLVPLVITDGIYAITGEIAPLDKIYPLVNKHNAKLVVDDAHSTGILGKNGLGTPEHFNLCGEGEIYQTETMSKALGSYGGFISGNKELIDLLREKSAIYRASTALPPHIVAAGIASLHIIKGNPGLRINLIKKTSQVREEIIGMGFNTTPDKTPIIPIMLNSLAMARSLSLFLEKNGIIVPAIDYPNKLEKNIVRITVSAIHKDKQIETLLKIIKKWRDKNGASDY